MKVIGFGGSCHWCTEAIFASLNGVNKVEQGWIASTPPNESWSEAVRVTFNPASIPLETLVKVHIHTHSSTSAHAMRGKYRSAIYTTNDQDQLRIKRILNKLQADFKETIITKVLNLKAFKLNKENFLNYYESNPEKPFCKRYIEPKLSLVEKKFASSTKGK